jgi:glutathione S-transferase
MQLYYHPISSNARRVLMAADHLGIQLDLVETNLMSEADRRRLAEVNDNNKIPVLVDDGFVLWESCAIMQYLADSQPGQTVYPHDPLARADVNRWMFWACQHFAPAVSVIAWENVWKKMVTGQDADVNEVAHAKSAAPPRCWTSIWPPGSGWCGTALPWPTTRWRRR